MSGMNEEERTVWNAFQKYATHYAAQEKTNMQYGWGENLSFNAQIYSSYLNYVSTKRIERLTYVLAFSTLALAVITAISLYLR